jgi:hypothetical protein
MKRLVAIALVLAASVIPASAQRGGSRGGFPGRAPSSAPAFHSSPSFSGISRAPMSMARPAPNARPSFYSANRYPGGRSPTAHPERNRYPTRRPSPFHGFGYGYPSGISYVPYPFLDSPFYDDEADDTGYNQEPPIPYADPGPDPAAYGYIQPEDQPQPYGLDPQQPAEIIRPALRPTPRSGTTARPEPAPAPATTLIFKDGRAPEQIRNYIATRSTVTVIDGPRHRDIPVADLDLPATISANRNSGAGFQLPAAP